ncbi:hypothetical protein SAMN05444921_111217 [Streptomyces wuyuanensis]|uniref:Uncharacterized protein n=1 Tax=Streptomyces wuyuanensis TaxID=1196353 RepID=A0A1G9V4F3_9ACTN|nr:hypothetical protein SAMN05444921_111217 [Streptomyces wuyuanensis]
MQKLRNQAAVVLPDEADEPDALEEPADALASDEEDDEEAEEEDEDFADEDDGELLDEEPRLSLR